MAKTLKDYLDESMAQTEANMILDLSPEDRELHLIEANHVLSIITAFLRTIPIKDMAFQDSLDMLTCYALFGLEYICKLTDVDFNKVTNDFVEEMIDTIQKDDLHLS